MFADNKQSIHIIIGGVVAAIVLVILVALLGVSICYSLKYLVSKFCPTEHNLP